MEQEPRICLLCGSPVRLFFINFSEKLLMCEDPNCDFPFGYEELQIVTDESELRETFETASSISLGPYNGMSAASSVISTTAWSDIERLNRIYDSEDSIADSRLSFTIESVIKQRERRKTQEEIQKNLDNIKKLNAELNLLKHADRGCIEKDNWLKNLLSLQGLSGRQLLKEKEIEKLKKTEPDFGMGELKINISTVPNDNGLINIEIINEENESQNGKDCGDGDTQEIKMQMQGSESNNMHENYCNDDPEENLNNEKINLAHNPKAIQLINTDSVEEIKNQVNNDICHIDDIPSNDTLPELNIHFNEITDFVTDSDMNYDDTNLVDVKTVVIDNNSFTLIELKGAQDISSQNVTENIEGDIEMDLTNGDRIILDNEPKEDNINKQNINDQKVVEKTENLDTIINNLTETNEEITTLTNSNENPNTDNNLNDAGSNENYLETRKANETPESETSAINKEIKLLLEIEKLQANYEKNQTSNIVEMNAHKKSGNCEKEQVTLNDPKKIDLMNNSKQSETISSENQEGNMVNLSKESHSVIISKKSKKSDKNSRDQEDIINDSKESELINNAKESKDKEKRPKKRGRAKKGTKLSEQPVRRSNRLSK